MQLARTYPLTVRTVTHRDLWIAFSCALIKTLVHNRPVKTELMNISIVHTHSKHLLMSHGYTVNVAKLWWNTQRKQIQLQYLSWQIVDDDRTASPTASINKKKINMLNLTDSDFPNSQLWFGSFASLEEEQEGPQTTNTLEVPFNAASPLLSLVLLHYLQ